MKSISTSSFTASRKSGLSVLFKSGLIAKGVVYCLLGILTVMAAMGLRGKNASKTDAFNVILEQPFGKVLLIVLAIGLFGFVILRLFQAVKDIDHKGSDAKGLVNRIGFAISAVIYASMGAYAVKLALANANGGGDSKKFLVAKVLDLPAGVWLIGIAAIIIMISGGYQIYKGGSKKFMKKIQLTGSRFSKVFERSGVIGYVSRGVVMLVIGYLLFHAAIDHSPRNVKDTDGAFSFLEQNFGSVLMGIIALGLAAYGVFMFVKAKYEKLQGE